MCVSGPDDAAAGIVLSGGVGADYELPSAMESPSPSGRRESGPRWWFELADRSLVTKCARVPLGAPGTAAAGCLTSITARGDWERSQARPSAVLVRKTPALDGTLVRPFRSLPRTLSAAGAKGRGGAVPNGRRGRYVGAPSPGRPGTAPPLVRRGADCGVGYGRAGGRSERPEGPVPGATRPLSPAPPGPLPHAGAR